MCKQKKTLRELAIERNTQGLTAVSTGVCGACKQCRNEYGLFVPCECGGDGTYESEEMCDVCFDNRQGRLMTMEEFGVAVSSGKIFSEGNFIRRGCDLCGSSLGGRMEPWHAIDANGELIHGDCACVDCVVWLANGDSE